MTLPGSVPPVESPLQPWVASPVVGTAHVPAAVPKPAEVPLLSQYHVTAAACTAPGARMTAASKFEASAVLKSFFLAARLWLLREGFANFDFIMGFS